MSILKSIITAIRGGATEIGETIVDSQAVRILEQEIRNAENAIVKAKQSLTALKASEIKLKREVSSLSQDISGYENKAATALDQGNEALALDVANRIAELEAEHSDKSSDLASLSKQVNSINSMIRKRSGVIQKNRRELDKVKTIKQIQATTTSLSNNIAATNSSGNRVSEALKRVKSKQQNWKDQMEAGEWMDQDANDDLDAKLKSAGIGKQSQSASDVLARLKRQREQKGS